MLIRGFWLVTSFRVMEAGGNSLSQAEVLVAGRIRVAWFLDVEENETRNSERDGRRNVQYLICIAMIPKTRIQNVFHCRELLQSSSKVLY